MIQHNFPIPVWYLPDSNNHPSVVPKVIITVSTYWDIYPISCTLYAITEWNCVSSLKIPRSWFCQGIIPHCYLTHTPKYIPSNIILENLLGANTFSFIFFHGANTYQFSKTICTITYLFVTSIYSCIFSRLLPVFV